MPFAKSKRVEKWFENEVSTGTVPPGRAYRKLFAVADNKLNG